MSKLTRYSVNAFILLVLCSNSCYSFAKSTFLECSLTASTSNTGSSQLRTIENNAVSLEIALYDETIEIHTQSPGFPIDLKINKDIPEWRTPEGYVYDSNKSSNRRYSLERVYEDLISVTQTSFELDRTTGELTQETSKTIGDDFTTITIIHGSCIPSKRQNDSLF